VLDISEVDEQGALKISPLVNHSFMFPKFGWMSCY